MRGMDKTPAAIDRGMVQQPAHRPRTAPRQAILHLAHLFGDMDMDRSILRQRQDFRQFIGFHRTQAVRRDADHRIGKAGKGGAACRRQPSEAVRAMEETALRRAGRLPAETAVRIEHRQQRQSDARRGSGSGKARGHFAGIGIGAPSGSWCR
jgi:hypothetical protein